MPSVSNPLLMAREERTFAETWQYALTTLDAKSLRDSWLAIQVHI